jgi:hypothetical protein
MPHQLKVGMANQMLDITPGAGEEIIETQNFIAALDQPFAQEGTEEARSASHQNSAPPHHRIAGATPVFHLITGLSGKALMWRSGSFNVPLGLGPCSASAQRIPAEIATP